MPMDLRKFQGAFFTPPHLVNKAYEYLRDSLGENWYKDYYIWDMASGTGNLLVNLPLGEWDWDNVFASSLVESELLTLKSRTRLNAQNVFQYDYLNDDIDDLGVIDYSISNKIPPTLLKVIKECPEKLLVFINPPYGEAGAGIAKGDENKSFVSKNHKANLLGGGVCASNELYIQFLNRIKTELSSCKLGLFCTLKFLVAEQSEIFREYFKATFLKGYMIQGDHFTDVSNQFAIGFFVFDINCRKIKNVKLDILDYDLIKIATKSINAVDKDKFLNKWIDRPKSNEVFSLPLYNSVHVKNRLNGNLAKACDGMITYFYCNANDISHVARGTSLYSSVFFHGHGLYVTADNLDKVLMVFTARRIIESKWYNANDQFLMPNETKLTNQFKADCLIYTIFNGGNTTASANELEYDTQMWSIYNNFIPFVENEIKPPSLASFTFESHFLTTYMKQNHTLQNASDEAIAVYSEAKKLWQRFFVEFANFDFRIIDDLKLNRSQMDYGWYQIRSALKSHFGTYANDEFNDFNSAYKKLAGKLRPLIYDYGFLEE